MYLPYCQCDGSTRRKGGIMSDNIKLAKGIFNGSAIGAALWALLIVAWMIFF